VLGGEGAKYGILKAVKASNCATLRSSGGEQLGGREVASVVVASVAPNQGIECP
ncbi:MAG: hypothetical protein JWO42_2683, partial [Chloroflexi bacterium]|nr:hypothetical protein [Chloroflexota bacterium]